MKVSKSLLWIIIIILFITLIVQNKVLLDKVKEQHEYQFTQGGDILKAQTIDSLKYTLSQYDSLINRYEWSTDLYFYDIHTDTTQAKVFKSLMNEKYEVLQSIATGGN
jgi:hypothetical protein